MSIYEVIFFETFAYSRMVEAASEKEARELCDYDAPCQVPNLVQQAEFYNFSVASVELLEDSDEDSDEGEEE